MKRTPLAIALGSALALTACGQSATPAGTSTTTETATATQTPAATPTAKETLEAAGHTPRLAVTYDGGVLVVDAASGTVEGDFPAQGFTRLNQAGDGRHLLLTEGNHFRVLDMGSWTKAHGDHGHSFKTSPALTDVTFEGEHPGHAVFHAERTALFYDGEGRIEWFEPTAMALEKPRTTQVKLPAAHHGVALWREDDTLVHTLGTEDERHTVAISDANGRVIAKNEKCPGVHGEAAAKGALVIGCEDGLLVLKGNSFTKVASPDGYGRIGNQAGSEDSPVVLGDYKVDKDAELERPTRITLTDTRTGKLKLVDLGASYSFRSLGRGPEGEALVLGTDGNLHVIDEESGKHIRKVKVVKPWTEPTEWQQPRPTLFVQDDHAWVTEPAAKKLHLVHLADGSVEKSIDLPRTPNEINGVEG